MIAESGVRRVTMDALAERAKLGKLAKGSVFRRFGSRCSTGRRHRVPGADVTARLVACGPRAPHSCSSIMLGVTRRTCPESSTSAGRELGLRSSD
ncbi:hypothetical protein [Streptomyces sp. NPDC060275]|uniref:hypothetical protein n=1 Tax=Streptomyces sp. NPDC060275 TaxID=3347090 RepID=UPI003656A5CA